MTTGFTYAALFYFVSLIVTGLLAVTLGDAFSELKPQFLFTWLLGLLVIAAPAGFVFGLRLNRKKREQLANPEPKPETPQQYRERHQTKTVRPVSPPKKHRGFSEETREYLEKTRHVDTKGLTEFLKETRSHQIEEMKKSLENGSAGA
ncbi:MAG: hypothetical protein AAF585_04525 [Verrucomicrobiota bacterium]